MITIVVNGKDSSETMQRVKIVFRLLPHCFAITSVLKGIGLDSDDYLLDSAVTKITDKRRGIAVKHDKYSEQACRLIHIMLPYVWVIEGTATDTIKNSDIP